MDQSFESQNQKAERPGFIFRLKQLPTNLIVGVIILSLYVVIAITGRYWVPYEYAEVGTGLPLSDPSAEHLFGTDHLGRDVFSRVVSGTGIVLILSFTSTVLATILGGTLGLLSGFLDGWVDEFLMRTFEFLISIPMLILALLIITAVGPRFSGNPVLLILVVMFLWMPRIGRVTRSVAVDLATRDFVTAARARGESAWSIVWRELAPNSSSVLLVEFGVRASASVLVIGGLGFLGFGVNPPHPEWGLMISESRKAIASAPVTVLAPALALAGLVMGINLLTDGIGAILGRTATRGV